VITTKAQKFSETAKRITSALTDGINHLLWPAVCNNCQVFISESQGGLCKSCWEEILGCVGGDYCGRCGRDVSKYAVIDGGCANCQQADIHYDAIARGGVYNDALRDMILRFKFNDRTELDLRLCFIADSALSGSGFAERIDMFVPVPLHWIRRMQRGYNQSLLICKGLKHQSAKIDTDLVRIRNTQRQWKLSPTKRKKNVADAFAVRKGNNFSDKTICLVDDITTSGATLNECAKILKQAGAKKVFALVVAVAMQDTA